MKFIWQIKPLSVRYGLGIPDHDSEGRLVTAEFDSFYLISGYVPNSGDGLRRLVPDLNTSLFISILLYIIFILIEDEYPHLTILAFESSLTELLSGIHLSAIMWKYVWPCLSCFLLIFFSFYFLDLVNDMPKGT